MTDPQQGWSASQSTWNDRARTAAIVAALVALAWWGWSAISDYATSDTAQRKDQVRQRDSSSAARARQLLHQGPRTNAWQTNHGSVIQIDIPVDRYKTGDVDFQRCFVWRDPASQAAAMHCDQEPVPDTGSGP